MDAIVHVEAAPAIALDVAATVVEDGDEGGVAHGQLAGRDREERGGVGC